MREIGIRVYHQLFLCFSADFGKLFFALFSIQCIHRFHLCGLWNNIYFYWTQSQVYWYTEIYSGYRWPFSRKHWKEKGTHFSLNFCTRGLQFYMLRSFSRLQTSASAVDKIFGMDFLGLLKKMKTVTFYYAFSIAI